MDKFVIKKQYPEVKTFKHIHIHENAYNDLKELSAMIDGNPESISLVLDEYSISKSGANITYDNETTSVDEYQPYEVNFAADDGYATHSVLHNAEQALY